MFSSSYFLIRDIHIFCVILSGAGFFVRGVGMLRGAAWLSSRPARTLPHLIDTFLLLSALTLAYMSGQWPFRFDWLTAKFFGLCAYIVLGTIALKRGRTVSVRAAAWVGALLVFAWIVSVAMTRHPMGFLVFI